MRTKPNLIAVLILSTITLLAPSLAYANVVSINLPPDEVSMRIIHPAPNCYYYVVLSDIPSGYHVSNGQYLGWCVDEYHCIYTDVTYKARIYSSYDPSNPHPDEDWDKVNYIINHKQGLLGEVQAAIWRYVNSGIMPKTAAGQAMVNDADANGEGFVPGPGQVMAVVLWVNSSIQVAIVEVFVPLRNVVPEYPFGPFLGVVTFIIALGLFKYRHPVLGVFKFRPS